ncbi:hypothetical protein D7X48_21510 [bacterium D16-50]|nr:hypothetical protein D7X48_21510 [bacterium D16-50]
MSYHSLNISTEESYNEFIGKPKEVSGRLPWTAEKDGIRRSTGCFVPYKTKENIHAKKTV